MTRSRRKTQAKNKTASASPTHGPWPTAVTTVALSGMSFWCLSVLLAAGIDLSAATAAIVAVLLSVSRISAALGGKPNQLSAISILGQPRQR